MNVLLVMVFVAIVIAMGYGTMEQVKEDEKELAACHARGLGYHDAAGFGDTDRCVPCDVEPWSCPKNGVEYVPVYHLEVNKNGS